MAVNIRREFYEEFIESNKNVLPELNLWDMSHLINNYTKRIEV